MKKKILATLMVAFTMIGMAGCGDSSASANQSSTALEANSERSEGSELAAESESSEIITDEYGRIYNRELGIYVYPSTDEPENDRVGARPMGDEGDDFVAAESSEALPGESDSVDDYSGIIMCAFWTYFNGSQYIVFSLDPDTGEYTEISRLSYWQEDGKYYYNVPLLPYYSNYGSKFNADFTKVAATYTVYGTKASRAGWVDTNGVFFDVAEAVGMGAENDFVAQPDYYSIGFTDDGCFVFAEVVGCKEKIDSDNIEKYATFYYISLDDPTVAYEGNPLAEEATHGKKISGYPSCWINEDEYIADQNNQTVIRRVSDPNYVEEYISGEVRNNWSGIVGPDGTIAFVSMPKKGGYDMGIYIIQRDGSGLERIFTCDDLFEYAGNRTANFYRMQLISWQ